MRNIAVLLTCFNRKDKTIKCLEHLYRAVSSSRHQVDATIYLTDNGSDDTDKCISTLFPGVNVLKGSRTLYWAGGMRNSWTHALNRSHEGFLLLNDDTNVMGNVFDEIFDTHSYCMSKYNTPGIYIGSTVDPNTNKLTYGGAIIINNFLGTYKILEPNGFPQNCKLGNGNIMFVSAFATEKIGILSDKYIHGIADYDYTLTAVKHKIPVMIMPAFCGECSKEPGNKYDLFNKMSFSERIKFLKSPLGFDFPGQLRYMRKNFPYRLPFIFLMAWFKVVFPRIYPFINKLR